MATLLPEQATENWTPSTEVEKGAVQQQLEKLLATSLFNSSKRYPSFLRFAVTRALAGQTDQLKERLLGVEIFGRPADYDTNTDPIVRVTAAEIRKRIEQYYQDPRHSQEIRLFLPSGSYAPQFSWPGHPHSPGLPATVLELPAHASDTPVMQPPAALEASLLAGMEAHVCACPAGHFDRFDGDMVRCSALGPEAVLGTVRKLA